MAKNNGNYTNIDSTDDSLKSSHHLSATDNASGGVPEGGEDAINASAKSASSFSSFSSSTACSEVREISSTSPTPLAQAATQHMSKSQRKKFQKRQLRQQLRQENKQRRKQARRNAAIAAGRDLQAEQEFLRQRTLTGDRQRRPSDQWQQRLNQSTKKGHFQICIDCSFSNSMTEREIASLAQQLRYCYSYNKRASSPSIVTVTSVGGTIRTLLEKESGFLTWPQRGFICTPTSLEEYFNSQDRSKLIYLTSDSPTVLQQLENDKIYIIGGIVDRNRLKGVTMTRATKHLGIATAKLPLEEHCCMSTTRVLTCNHVFHILIQCREFGNDWSKALHHVLPPRKGAEIWKAGSNGEKKVDPS
jgi:tRNA (guanine9-N1)-methyltransferase